jgi:hemoglobin
MEIEKAGQNVFVVREIYHASSAEIASREIGIDFKKFAVANDNADIAADAIVDGIENPAASQDCVPRLERISDLSEQNGNAEWEEGQEAFHREMIARRSCEFVVRGRRLAWARDACHYGGMRTVFEAAGGMEGLRRLAGAWHCRVMADEVVGHAFSHGFHPQHVERLAAYWAEALGGPSMYSESYGDETTVVRIHSGNGVHDEMDRRAIVCFDQALVDVGLAGDSALRQVLHDYFAWATTTTMAGYHQSADDVPIGLSIPQWSWDGLQV